MKSSSNNRALKKPKTFSAFSPSNEGRFQPVPKGSDQSLPPAKWLRAPPQGSTKSRLPRWRTPAACRWHGKKRSEGATGGKSGSFATNYNVELKFVAYIFGEKMWAEMNINPIHNECMIGPLEIRNDTWENRKTHQTITTATATKTPNKIQFKTYGKQKHKIHTETKQEHTHLIDGRFGIANDYLLNSEYKLHGDGSATGIVATYLCTWDSLKQWVEQKLENVANCKQARLHPKNVWCFLARTDSHGSWPPAIGTWLGC